jgi:ESAT-6 family protein
VIIDLVAALDTSWGSSRMGGGFEVSSADLRACGSRLKQISDEVRDAMGDFARDVDDVLSHWRGDAATGFTAGWEEWLGGARDVLEGLTAMGDALRDVSTNYTRMDAAAADTVTGPGGGMP